MSNILFGAAVVILLGTLAGAVWSAAVPDKRLWPPPCGRGSWPYVLNWAGFYAVCGINVLLLLMYWNSWIFQSPLRFVVGIPMVVLGGLLALWGMVAIGWRNTSGLKGGFVSTGPYRITRNPQYVGDIVLFLGVSVIANSLLLWITHLLIALVFIVAPFAEEPWLEEQYGDAYREYRQRVRRFL
ncbi:MAG: isoprenylcysteine carboxylmethyltransferase family protein [Gemmatimonadetes bacterium]|nr:isoprenylcysteine carboxylmethyltransferase family protein [Gemmatimonadota bacterium]